VSELLSTFFRDMVYTDRIMVRSDDLVENFPLQLHENIYTLVKLSTVGDTVLPLISNSLASTLMYEVGYRLPPFHARKAKFICHGRYTGILVSTAKVATLTDDCQKLRCLFS